MSRTWLEHDVVNQEYESTHTRPWLLDTREKAIAFAKELAEAANNPEAKYTVIEKRCREIETILPESNDG